jgi:ATP-dependent DNA helicase RecG
MGTDLINLKGVGPALVTKLEKLKVYNQYDLLFLLPTRYEDKTTLRPINTLAAGEKVLTQGTIILSTIVYRGRRMLICQLSDESGIITLRFFNFSKQQAKGLSKNTIVRCFGQTRKTASGLEMIHPEYQIINPDHPTPLETGLTPIYPATEGLQQGRLRKIIGAAIDQQIDSIEELLPSSIVKELGLVPLTEALREIHQPSQKNTGNEHENLFRKRLIIEELLANQLALKRLKRRTKKEPALVLSNTFLKEALITALPFKLTKSQLRVVEEIELDLNKNQPMMRLLQGDVGSGKTIVAALAMLIAVDSKQQVVLMAPTELLAEQHFDSLASWFEPLGVSVALLKSKLSAKDKRNVFAGIAEGTISVVVGTHALFQPNVVYKHLALVVVDEQHRFGVEQRLSLMKKSSDQNSIPHQLIMTATPIPRTLAMTAYGDLDASIIDEPPKGRGVIRTFINPEDRRNKIMDKISKECKVGRQVYWVCPLIEESDELDFQAAESTYIFLKEKLPKLHIGLVHGKLSSAKKIKEMANFKKGNTNILVATTVIEVGVDVANASVMVIENAERLGLSQLHQLRGRIGRGKHESFCFLIYKQPLSSIAKERLAAIRATNDGFVIAEKDLQLRGPGELLGTRQKGLIGLRIADIMRDAYLLPAINKLTVNIEQNHPDVIDKIVRRWVGDELEYRNV